MMPHDYEDLTDLDGAWEEISDEPKTGGFIANPPGEYSWEIEDAGVDSWPDGKKFLEWRMKVIDGPHKGSKERKRRNIERKGLEYLKSEMMLCGLRCLPSAIESRAHEMRGARIRGKVTLSGRKQNGDPYRNVYFNAPLPKEETGVSFRDEAEADVERNPF